MVAARRNQGASWRGTGWGAPPGAVWQTAAMPDDRTATADLVLLGASLRTMVPASPRAEALAVRDGRIVAVGRDEDVRRHVGPRTRVVELGGRTVTPGFQDAHVHPIGAGLDAIRCNLHGLPGRDAYLAAIADYAASHPDLEWITGGGWALDDFPGGRHGPRISTGSFPTGRSSSPTRTATARG